MDSIRDPCSCCNAFRASWVPPANRHRHQYAIRHKEGSFSRIDEGTLVERRDPGRGLDARGWSFRGEDRYPGTNAILRTVSASTRQGSEEDNSDGRRKLFSKRPFRKPNIPEAFALFIK